MSAIVQWKCTTSEATHDACSARNANQPFIWAVGPNKAITSNEINYAIQEHSQYGVFFANMPQSQNIQIDDPVFSGFANRNVKPQPGVYHNLIVVHATLLFAAFLIVFPAAVVGLRLNLENSFRLHWMSQVFGSVGVLVGLTVAIVTSIIGIRYAHLHEPHQIVGILICLSVGLQVYLGRMHHIHHVLEQKRTWYSHAHFILGRLAMYGGMVNAIL